MMNSDRSTFGIAHLLVQVQGFFQSLPIVDQADAQEHLRILAAIDQRPITISAKSAKTALRILRGISTAIPDSSLQLSQLFEQIDQAIATHLPQQIETPLQLHHPSQMQINHLNNDHGFVGTFNGPVSVDQRAYHQNDAASEDQDLEALAKDVRELLDQLKMHFPTLPQNEIAQQLKRAIAHNPTLKNRLIQASVAGGTEALKVIFNHPAVSIPAEVIKGFLEA